MAYRVTITTERMKVTQGYHSSWRDRMDNIMTQLIFWEQPRQRCREGSSKVGNLSKAIHSQQQTTSIDNIWWMTISYQTRWHFAMTSWTDQINVIKSIGEHQLIGPKPKLEWVIVWRQLICTFTEYPLDTDLAPHVILSEWNIIGTQIPQKQWQIQMKSIITVA